MELWIVLLTALANLFLGLIVYKKNPRSATHYLLAILTLILASWTISNYFSLNSVTSEGTLMWIRLVMVITTPLCPVIYLFLSAFPKKNIGITKKKIIMLLVSMLLVSICCLTPLTFSGVVIKNGVHPQPGYGIILYGLLALFCLISGFVTIVKKYRSSSNLTKLQLKYLVLGAILTFSIEALTNFILVVVFDFSGLVIFGPAFSLIFVGLIAYSIIKHRLMDIRLVIARTIAYSLLVATIGVIFIASTIILSSLFFGFRIVRDQLALYTILTILVAFFFESIRSFAQKLTDTFFYKGHYELSQLLSSLGNITSNQTELDTLTSQILKKLTKEMRISGGVFIVLEGNTIYSITSEGYAVSPVLSFNMLIPFLESNQLIVYDELDQGILKQLMQNLDIRISRTLKVEDKNVGILLLKEKLSGEAYEEQDLKIIDAIVPEIAIAIQNSQSFDKIKKFNVTLTQEVQKATSELKLANLKLEELDQLKDDFVSVASHELRTPMTAIRSYAWMALHRSDMPLSDKLQKYLTRTLSSTERLINLVNNMLNISRIESGRIEILPEVFDVRSLADEVLIEVGPKAAEKSLNLRIYSSQVPKVYADVDKVHQVLLNLIGNAMKFTPNGGDITLSFFSDGYTVDVAVKDTGVGITRDDLSRLFKKFGRLDNSYVAAATSGGTGLGLFISKSLIDRMGGKIWAVSSGLGKGSTFTFTLPIATKEVLANAQKYSNKVAENQVKYLEPVAI